MEVNGGGRVEQSVQLRSGSLGELFVLPGWSSSPGTRMLICRLASTRLNPLAFFKRLMAYVQLIAAQSALSLVYFPSPTPHAVVLLHSTLT